MVLPPEREKAHGRMSWTYASWPRAFCLIVFIANFKIADTEAVGAACGRPQKQMGLPVTGGRPKAAPTYGSKSDDCYRANENNMQQSTGITR